MLRARFYVPIPMFLLVAVHVSSSSSPCDLVSLAAAPAEVTQCPPSAWGRGALRDFGPSVCEGDYLRPLS